MSQAHGLSTVHMLKWCIDLAGVLAFLHKSDPPIAHRDLKLENVMLVDKMVVRERLLSSLPETLNSFPSPMSQAQSEIRLIDFGLACPLSEEDLAKEDTLIEQQEVSPQAAPPDKGWVEARNMSLQP